MISHFDPIHLSEKYEVEFEQVLREKSAAQVTKSMSLRLG
jgi:hypothetical protein